MTEDTLFVKCDVCGHTMRNAGVRCDYCYAVDSLVTALRVAAWNFQYASGEYIERATFTYDPGMIDVAIEMVSQRPEGGS